MVVVGGDEQFPQRIRRILRARWPDVMVWPAGVTLGTIVLLENSHPELLVIGPCRPGVCYDLLRRVRSMSDVPIIVISGRDDVAYQVRALESGADDWLGAAACPVVFMVRAGALLRRLGGADTPAGAAPCAVPVVLEANRRTRLPVHLRPSLSPVHGNNRS